MAALDIFTLLSTAHEGISQASLQAAFLKKPLITTPVGGLPEVCLDGITGILVPPSSPQQICQDILQLVADDFLLRKYGRAAWALVEEKFTLQPNFDQMDGLYYR